MLFLSPYPGEFAALGAALIWAGASIVYQGVGKQVSPLVLNCVKGVMAIGFLLVTLALRGHPWPAIPEHGLALLALSGVVGIGIGDTAYFAAINCIGPRRTLLMETLAPPLATLLAWWALQETLSLSACVGIGLTLTGVSWVVLERIPAVDQASAQPLRGIAWGLLAALAQAGGAVLSRSALVTTDIDPLWSALIRIAAGTMALLPIVLARSSRSTFALLATRRLLTVIGTTALFSTYLGIWLQQISLKYAATGIAQALSSTSPLFVIPLVMYRGEKVSARAIAGVFVALIGVGLILSHSK
jgi:drug/metabolite transporter (DMT)-like permease